MKFATAVKRARRATRRKRQRGWRKVAAKPLFSCAACGRSYSNPLGHVCKGGGDFGKRRRAVQRKAKAATRAAKRKADRQKTADRIAAVRATERQRAADRVSTTRRHERLRANQRVATARAKAKAARPAPRPRSRPAHDYRNCRDHDCERVACEAYREGVVDGSEDQ